MFRGSLMTNDYMTIYIYIYIYISAFKLVPDTEDQYDVFSKSTSNAVLEDGKKKKLLANTHFSHGKLQQYPVSQILKNYHRKAYLKTDVDSLI